VLKNGDLPPEDLLAIVRAHLNDESVRPLTDTVIVAAPEPVEYAISGGWYLLRGNSPLAESIKARVDAAVEEFRVWQRSMPGRDINPTRLVALMERAGAKRVVVDSPTFTDLEDRQIARETTIDIEFFGVEDE
jgi:phage-related baseplate assembly protein